MTSMLLEFETIDAQDLRDILNHVWDPEKKKLRLKDAENLFKRIPETPPPSPGISSDKELDLGLNLT